MSIVFIIILLVISVILSTNLQSIINNLNTYKQNIINNSSKFLQEKMKDIGTKLNQYIILQIQQLSDSIVTAFNDTFNNFQTDINKKIDDTNAKLDLINQKLNIN